jgi:hypothetical protein
VSINTVSKLLEEAGEVCAAFHDEHVRGVNAKRVRGFIRYTATSVSFQMVMRFSIR